MAGLIIYGTYGQFYSFITADDVDYEKTSEDFANNPYIKIPFEKGDLTLQQIDEARDKISKIVKKLNDKQKIDVEKELSDYFN